MKPSLTMTRLGLTAMLFVATQVHAGLLLTIDLANETVLFSGSDSGTPQPPSPADQRFERLGWLLGSGDEVADTISLKSSAALTINPSPFAASLAGGPTRLSLNLVFDRGSPLGDVTGPVSLTGHSLALSYAGWASANKAFLESLRTGDLMPLTDGTGASPIEIRVVPDPVSVPTLSFWGLSLLAAVIALLGGLSGGQRARLPQKRLRR